jgi:hypothetical protein
VAFPSFDDLNDAGRREALSRPTRLTPEIFRTPGSDVNIAMAVGASMAERVAVYAQGEFNALRLRTVASVSDEAAEILAKSEFDETRRGALQAIVPLVFSRQPSLTSTSVPKNFLVGTAGGVTFRTATDLLFQGPQIGPFTVLGVATTAGPGGNVPAGTITRTLSPLSDTTITVTNDEPATGGKPAETIEELIGRCGTAYQRARKGTLTAIEEDAAIVRGVASARAYEQLDGDALTGRVIVQILGEGGTSNSGLADRVRTALRSTRAAGVPVLVYAMSPRIVAVEAYSLIIEPGFDASLVFDRARRSVVALFENLKVGDTMYRAQILSSLISTEGLKVPSASLVSPADDVVPAGGEFLRTTLENVYLTRDAP